MTALPDPPKRVLIVKPSALGDVATAVPVLRGLRRTFPEARVDWLVGEDHAGLIEHDSQLDEAIPFRRKRLGRAGRSPAATAELIGLLRRLRRGRYDWVLDLQGLFRSGFFARVTGSPVRAGFADAREGAARFYTHAVRPTSPHTVDRNIELARALGVQAGPEDLRLEIAPHARRAAADLLAAADLPPGRFVLCAPPTRWPTKGYPVRLWRRVLERLVRRAPVALTGGRGDAELCAAVAEGLAGVTNLAGRTDVAGLVALTASAAAVVCCDSALKFIAEGVGVPSVTVTGPTRPERTGPYRLGRAVRAATACRGCLRRRCPHVTCMQSIPPEAVADGVETVLTF